jgi:hypothetical protein
MKNFFLSLGYILVGIAIMVIVGVLCCLFFLGAAWVGDKILPILNLIVVIAFFLILVFGSPLLFFCSVRHIPGQAWIYWSYACAVSLWFCSLIVTLQLWGVIAAIIGMLLGGIGIFPVAVLAAMIKGEWSIFWQLMLSFALVIGAQFFGTLMIKKSAVYYE